MSSSIFLAPNNPQTQNPNYSTNYNNMMMGTNYDHDHHNQHQHHQDQDFEISDFLAMTDIDHLDECSNSSFTPPISQEITSGSPVISTSCTDVPRKDHIRRMKRAKMDVGLRIAFKTKSELEIMDDGFKWRKYGKKMVKDSPHPRNYYKCASVGCKVKKRVERDRDDYSYVITTYDGRHNHESPCIMYYNQMPLSLVPSGWA